MANNPEFQMHGITFVIATPSGDRHALPFKIGSVELQRSLHSSYTVIDVVRELRELANAIEATVALAETQSLASG
jgi:hypothetical protein